MEKWASGKQIIYKEVLDWKYVPNDHFFESSQIGASELISRFSKLLLQDVPEDHHF